MTRQRGADACHDPPPRWWTDAEVRAALGRRATLDAVDTTPQPDGTLWQAHYSVGRGGELIGSVRRDRAGAPHALLGARALPSPEGVRGSLLLIEGEPGLLSYRLELWAAGDVRVVEWRLPRSEAPPPAGGNLTPEPLPTPDEVAAALLRLYRCLWG